MAKANKFDAEPVVTRYDREIAVRAIGTDVVFLKMTDTRISRSGGQSVSAALERKDLDQLIMTLAYASKKLNELELERDNNGKTAA